MFEMQGLLGTGWVYPPGRRKTWTPPRMTKRKARALRKAQRIARRTRRLKAK